MELGFVCSWEGSQAYPKVLPLSIVHQNLSPGAKGQALRSGSPEFRSQL